MYTLAMPLGIPQYPNEKYWYFDHLRGSTVLSVLVQHAAVIVDNCGHSPRPGDGVLVCLQHFTTHVLLVLTKPLYTVMAMTDYETPMCTKQT